MTILDLPCIAKAHVGGTLSTAAVGVGAGAAIGVEVTPHQQQQHTPSQASVVTMPPPKVAFRTR